MRHNHKNHIGSPCRFVFDVLPNWKNRNPHRLTTKIRKTALFLPKNRKPDAKKGENRKPQRTTKPKNRSFSLQKPKNRPRKWPKPKNRKSQRPPQFSLLFTLGEIHEINSYLCSGRLEELSISQACQSRVDINRIQFHFLLLCNSLFPPYHAIYAELS